MTLLERQYHISPTPPTAETNPQRWNVATKAFLEQVQSLLSVLNSNEVESMTRALNEAQLESKASEGELALAERIGGVKLTSAEKLCL